MHKLDYICVYYNIHVYKYMHMFYLYFCSYTYIHMYISVFLYLFVSVYVYHCACLFMHSIVFQLAQSDYISVTCRVWTPIWPVSPGSSAEEYLAQIMLIVPYVETQSPRYIGTWTFWVLYLDPLALILNLVARITIPLPKSPLQASVLELLIRSNSP